MRTNVDSLVKSVVLGVISDCACGMRPSLVGSEGNIVDFFGTGGVSINVSIGDPAFGWEADHIEPGVSLIHTDEAKKGALANLSCIGNEAVIVKAAMNDVERIVGKKGFVTGKHGGAERLMVWFDKKTISYLSPDDVIRIESYGFNLKLIDYPEIYLRSLSPDLLERLPISEDGKKISIGVTRILPAVLMGSGIGSGNTFRGDVDIQSTDERAVSQYKIENLRLGDIVAIKDFDTTFGASFRRGSMTIGVIIHGASRLSGHGPGVTTILSTRKPGIICPYEKAVNLSDLYCVNSK